MKNVSILYIEQLKTCSIIIHSYINPNSLKQFPIKSINISELLKTLNLCQHEELMEEERIDLDMLLTQEELMEMFRDIGILS